MIREQKIRAPVFIPPECIRQWGHSNRPTALQVRNSDTAYSSEAPLLVPGILILDLYTLINDDIMVSVCRE